MPFASRLFENRKHKSNEQRIHVFHNHFVKFTLKMDMLCYASIIAESILAMTLLFFGFLHFFISASIIATIPRCLLLKTGDLKQSLD